MTVPTAMVPTATAPTATAPTATVPTATVPTATVPTATVPTGAAGPAAAASAVPGTAPATAEPVATTATTATTAPGGPIGERVAYASVQAVFERSCYRCHGARKRKGDLRLDDKAAAMKGGEHGVVIVPGDAKKSKLYKSITLPRGHEDHMPAKGDPLTEAEIALVGRWIDEGAIWPD